jgi:5'-deoxynucleotidase YfbR-like HD superfamily hydrolase
VNPAFANEIMTLWDEYEEGKSEAARLVHGVDALECMTQATEYEERSRRKVDLTEFMGLESKARGTGLDDWVDHLKQERESVWTRGTDNMVVLFVLGMP